MARTFNIKLEGALELEEVLSTLPKRLAKGTTQRALVKVGEPIAADARRRAPVRTGRLQAHIKSATRLTPRQRRRRVKPIDAEAFVGVDYSLGYGMARHAHLIEFGTKERVQKTTGRRTGRVTADPFLGRAWDAGRARALADLGRLLWAEIEKTAERLRRRAAKRAGGAR